MWSMKAAADLVKKVNTSGDVKIKIEEVESIVVKSRHRSGRNYTANYEFEF